MKRLHTPKIKIIELRFQALLAKELELLPEKVSAEQLAELLPHIKEFAEQAHRQFSEYAAEALRQSKSPVCCKSKCPNCCHHYPMSVEPFELIALYSFLREAKDFPRIAEALWHRSGIFSKILKQKEENDALREYFSLSLPCPFIAPDGCCGIYELRPFSCRMYFSITKPKFCVPLYLQSPKNKNFIVYMPDELEYSLAMVSERYSELGLSEALYGGLLEMNRFEGAFSLNKNCLV